MFFIISCLSLGFSIGPPLRVGKYIYWCSWRETNEALQTWCRTVWSLSRCCSSWFHLGSDSKCLESALRYSVMRAQRDPPWVTVWTTFGLGWNWQDLKGDRETVMSGKWLSLETKAYWRMVTRCPVTVTWGSQTGHAIWDGSGREISGGRGSHSNLWEQQWFPRDLSRKGFSLNVKFT